MNKTLATALVLGTSAALLLPTTGAWAKGGDDDGTRVENGDDSRGRDRDRSDDRNDDDSRHDANDDNGGRGSDDSPSGSDDDGTPDQGRGDGSTSTRGRDDSQVRGRDRDRGRDRNRAEVRRSGQCSADSFWRLRVKTKKDRLRIKFQVKTGVAGQEWTYAIADNGTEVKTGTRVSHGATPDFSVQYRERGIAPGGHDVTATATNGATGETCDAAASIPAA